MTPSDASNGQRDARRPMPPSIRPASAPERRSVVPPSQGASSTTPPGASRRPESTQWAQEPSRPQQTRPAPRASSTPPKKKRKRHPCCTVAAVILVGFLAYWLIYFFYVNSNINTVDALSGAADTPGKTYLIVGSDSREGWEGADATEGARTDTIMLLHKPESGPVALISIPRDSYVEIPGYNDNKVNAAFSFGGPQLLVETVENLSGLTIDDYFEVGFTGVAEIVDAIGGVELCYPEDVSDEKSKMEWEAGCHVVNGEEALAFSRMRYSDPKGDIGRTERQQQLVGAVANEVLSPATVLNPFTLYPVTKAGLDAFRVSEGTGPFDLAGFALTFRSGLGGQAVTGTPPIADLGYSVDGVGSTVLLDPDEIDQFWEDIAEGAYEPGEVVGGIE